MIQFELAEPTTLADAVRLLDPSDETIRPIAGGTALMLMMKAGVFRPAKLVSLRKIERQYTAIAANADGLTIGAMTTLGALERSAEVRKLAPLITRTCLTLSNIRVRNVATVGGALAHGDPHMDLPPVLIALGAHITVASKAAERRLPVEGLYVGYYETVLKRDEVITAVTLPAQAARRAVYMKVTTRAVHDWPALGIAVSLDSDGASLREARIVVSAATETPRRLPAAEKVLRSGSVGDALFRKAGDAASQEAELI